MTEQFARTYLLLGKEGLERLKNSTVAVFGVGGVGGYAVEALARSGVGALVLVDNDVVCESNINRQIIATHESVGRSKVDVARERILSINPDCCVTAVKAFYLPENGGEYDFSAYDYVIDAIDTVKGKLGLIEQAQAAGTPIISAMGAGNKLDPTLFRVADIYETSVCPLARVMRTECRKRGIKHLKVVYSTELARKPLEPPEGEEPAAGRRSTPGSVAFVPAVAGLILAGEVIRDLAGVRTQQAT